jgi:G3E family GTPase
VLRSEKNHNTAHSTNEFFQTFGYETPKQFSTDELENIVCRFRDEKNFGKVIRAKGILQKTDKTWIQFDYVPGEFVTRETTADYASRLCVIGSQLNKEQLSKLFQA